MAINLPRRSGSAAFRRSDEVEIERKRPAPPPRIVRGAPQKRLTKLERKLRSPAVPWIAAGLVCLGLALALYGRHRATLKPEFALREIERAIRNHDGTKLAYYADVGALTDQIVDETTDWLVAERGVSAIPLDSEVTEDGVAGRLREQKRRLVSRIDRVIGAELISKRKFSGDVGPAIVEAFTSLPPLSWVLAGDGLELRGMDQSATEGGLAIVPVALRHRELLVDLTISLEFERAGPRWKLVAIRGLKKGLDAIGNAQDERVAIANRPREALLARLLEVGQPAVQVMSKRTKELYRLRLPLTNRAQFPVTDVTLGLTTRASDDAHATALEVHHRIPAGYTSAEIWQFDETSDRTSRAASLLTHVDRLRTRVRSIVLDSAGQADTVRLIRQYSELR